MSILLKENTLIKVNDVLIFIMEATAGTALAPRGIVNLGAISCYYSPVLKLKYYRDLHITGCTQFNGCECVWRAELAIVNSNRKMWLHNLSRLT